MFLRSFVTHSLLWKTKGFETRTIQPLLSPADVPHHGRDALSGLNDERGGELRITKIKKEIVRT